MAKLFNSDYSNILKHIKNIYKSGELLENTTMAKFATVVNRGFYGEKFSLLLEFFPGSGKTSTKFDFIGKFVLSNYK